MHSKDRIKPVHEIFNGPKIDLPEDPGVYAFWWIGDKKELLLGNIKLIFFGQMDRMRCKSTINHHPH